MDRTPDRRAAEPPAAGQAHPAGEPRRAPRDAVDAYIEASLELIVVHRGGTILRANAAFAAFLGYASPTELVGRAILELVHPASRDGVADRMQKIATEGANPPQVQGMLRRDGTTVLGEFVACTVPLDGAPATMVVGRDITERAQAIKALARAEEVLQLTIEQAPVGFAMTTLDGRFVRVNRWWAEMTGYSPSELLGMSFRELTHPDDMPANVALLAQLHAGEIPRFSLAKRYLHKSGRPIDVMIHCSIVRDDDGRPLHHVTLVEDVTEKLATERALRQAEEQFRLAIDQAPIGIALVGTDGRFLRVNRAWCEITGYAQDELLRMTFQDITPQEDLSEDLALAEQLVRGEIPRYTLAKHYLHKDGHPIDIRLHVSLVRDERGAPIHFISQIEDVTEHRKVQARLLQGERLAALGTLAGGVAHEVNNPLACVMSSLEVLADALRPSVVPRPPPLGPAEVEEIIRDTQEAAGRIRRIVRGLRVFSHGDESHPALIDVHDVLDTTVTLVAGELRNRARVTRRFEPVPRIVADEPRLAQVFLSVLVHAARAIAPGHAEENEIQIATRTREDGAAVVEVLDTGPALAPGVPDRLFEPFFTQADGQGAGLGLWVAHDIVASLGGDISAARRGERGTAVTIVLPAPSETKGGRAR